MTKSCILALEENPEDVYLETTSVLLKLADNVIKNPTNPKFRNLRLGNPTVANKLLPVVGAMECLFEMGFQEGEDSLILPNHIPLESLKSIRDEISSRRKSYKKPAEKTRREEPAASAVPRQPMEQLLMEKPRKPFLQRIEKNFQAVLQYEDKDLQAKALAVIPVVELEIAAQKNMRKLQKAVKTGQTKESEVDVQELVLLELLSWFKNSFFSWVNQPNCCFCSGATQFAGHKMGSGDCDRVEVYNCSVCNKHTHFARHNDPEKLLETRKGRCGEWANCFTLLCRALGYDARYVADETDHVWTEVYSGTQKRWLHCDPCENVCDAPLMYETGWGKKLSYIIAYSKDDIQDVTWRYSSKHREVMSRRTQCSEEELLSTILKLRQERQQNMSEAKRVYLKKRLLAELIEFLTPHKPMSEAEKQGRSSGSLAWRLARGETQVEEPSEPFIWKPMPGEIAAGKMHVLYSAARNMYVRGVGKEELPGWNRGVFQAKSVFRKEESDWKMAYLARTEGSSEGSISWKFDLTDTGMLVDAVEVLFHTQVYENGRVLLKLCASETCALVPTDKFHKTSDFSGNSQLELSAQLMRGIGDNAWQHAQLFRQEMSNTKDYPFEIVIHFKKA